MPDIACVDEVTAKALVDGDAAGGDDVDTTEEVAPETVVEPVPVVGSWVLTPDEPVHPAEQAMTATNPVATIDRTRIRAPRVMKATLSVTPSYPNEDDPRKWHPQSTDPAQLAAETGM